MKLFGVKITAILVCGLELVGTFPHKRLALFSAMEGFITKYLYQEGSRPIEIGYTVDGYTASRLAYA